MIRLMTLDDLSSVCDIENDLFNDHWSKDNFIYEIKDNPFSDIYVIDEDGIKGYVAISILYERLEINNLAIKREYQGQGLGQMLMDFVLDLAKSKALEVISLEVRTDNTKALNLYQKNGFITMRTRYHYYRDGDAYEMARGI